METKTKNVLIPMENKDIRDTQMCCPMCDTVLEHKEVGSTHIYVCRECPFLGMEFFTSENLKDLTDYLK